MAPMVNTTDRPIYVDGVRLDTLAWNIEKVNRATAQRRSADVSLANLDGALPSLNDSLEPIDFGLQMWLRGTDVDGSVPAGATSRDTFRTNLDTLLHLFGKRHALLEVREQVGAGAVTNNLITNPAFRVDATGWLTAGSTTVARSTAQAFVGTGSGLVSFTGANSASNAGVRFVVPVLAGRRYRFSAWLYVPAATPHMSLSVQGVTGTLVEFANRATTVKDAFQRVNLTWDATASGNASFYALNAAVTAAGQSLYVGAAMLEEVDKGEPIAYTNAYFDGDTTNDASYFYTWTGAANASSSLRTPKETRRALAKVTAAIAPDLNLPGTTGNFSVAVTIPAGMWEDPYSSDWAGTAGANTGTTQYVATLDGSTERINDATYLVKGPANNPRITDPSTGMYVELATNLSSTQFWRFNSATWASRYGTGLTLDSTDAIGTDGSSITNVGGPARGYGLPLVPVVTSGARRVAVVLTGAAFTAATQLSIRARRKFA